MSKEAAVDQLYVSLKFMLDNGIIEYDQYCVLQRKVLQWGGEKIPSESEAFGNDCPNGICEV